MKNKPGLLKRIRAWFDLEWVFPDDLGSGAISEITPALYLGGKPDLESVDDLRDRGITHVVSSIQGKYRQELSFLSSEFEHLFLEMDDVMTAELEPAVGTFIDFADAAWEDPKAKVFVHCEAGVSRSASLVVAMLMQSEDVSFIDAYEAVRKKRIRALPNIGFASQLQKREPASPASTTTEGPSSLALYLKRFCSVPGEIDELQQALERHDFDAPTALRSMYGGDIPRVVQGVRRS